MSDNDFQKKVNNLYNQKCSKYKNLQEKNVLPAVDKIIVIGDLHGDFEKTIQCLKLANVIKEDEKYPVDSKKRYKWIGGEMVIVQVGDQIDRCRNQPCHDPNSTNPDENSDIRILKFFTDLHFKALKKGGAVYSLVGNHELMNVAGRMDYVSYLGINEFEKEDSYGDKIYQKKLPNDLTNIDAREWSFKPGNPLAEFLACTRKLVLKIGDYLFVHAGILPEVARKYPGDEGIEHMNRVLSAFLFNSLDQEEVSKNQLLLGPEIMGLDNEDEIDRSTYDISPLWNRKFGFISRSDESEKTRTCKSIFQPIKKIYSVNKMFIGHTPQSQSINSSCEDGLWFTDVAMSKAFNSHGEKPAQVLLLEKDKEPVVLSY